MKCASCGYYNLPNVTVCGRCQRSLSPATAAVDTSFVDIYPPRARNRPKIWRLQSWWQQFAARIPRPRVDPAARQTGRIAMRQSLIAGAGIIPGLGAAIHRRKPEALAQSIAAVLLLVLFAATIHSDISNFFGTCFLLLLVYCQFDTLRLTYPPPDDAQRKELRLFRYATASIAIVALTSIVTMNLAGTLYMVGTNGLEPSLHRGDMMIVRNTGKVHRGEIVAADISGAVADYSGAIADHNVEIQGLAVERILGLPGDTVDLHAGALSVNGTRLTKRSMPLSRLRQTAEATITVPANSVCIWRPRLSVIFDDGPLPGGAEAVSPFMLVTHSSIIGRVTAVLSPARDRHIMK